MPSPLRLLLLALLACLAWTHALPDSPPTSEKVDHVTRTAPKATSALVMAFGSLPPKQEELALAARASDAPLERWSLGVRPLRDRLSWLCRRQVEGG